MVQVDSALRTGELVDSLTDVWEASVRATHTFLSPAYRGRRLGSRLLRHGMEHYHVDELTVNEQNPQARAFYGHVGFAVTERHELDDQGQPFPILIMRREPPVRG